MMLRELMKLNRERMKTKRHAHVGASHWDAHDKRPVWASHWDAPYDSVGRFGRLHRLSMLPVSMLHWKTL